MVILLLSEKQIKELLLGAGTDVEAEISGNDAIFYCDAQNVNVTTDKFYHFESWEDMKQHPIFWGKRFSEVMQGIKLYW